MFYPGSRSNAVDRHLLTATVTSLLAAFGLGALALVSDFNQCGAEACPTEIQDSRPVAAHPTDFQVTS